MSAIFVHCPDNLKRLDPALDRAVFDAGEKLT